MNYPGKGNVKLTSAQVSEARRQMTAPNPPTVRQLAAMYGVAVSALWNAVTGTTWRSVATPPVRPGYRTGERHHRAVLPDAVIPTVRRLFREGWSAAALARQYGMSERGMLAIVRGERRPGTVEEALMAAAKGQAVERPPESFVDRGCAVAPHCLECPLPVCRYERSLSQQKADARRAVVRERLAAGDSRAAVADELGLSVRAIYRLTGDGAATTQRRGDAKTQS